jgi:hypothetical protein
MTHSTDALEREAEALRNQVAYTAETLREKMSPGHVLDEYVDYLRHSDGSVAWHNLKTQIRDNPLPLALVGAGLAWFFLGGGPSTGRLRSAAEGYAAREDDRYVPDLWAGPRGNAEHGDRESAALEPLGTLGPGEARGERGNGSSTRRIGRTARSRISDAASSVSETAGSAYSAAGDAASSASEAVGDAASSASRTVAHSAEMARQRAIQTGNKIGSGSVRAGRQVQRTFSDMLEREPLVLGAIGIAAGAAIAAMLPRTRYEDEHIGPYRDQLREDAEEALAEGVEQAKDIAGEAYHAAKDEAERQKLTSTSERPVADRAAKVAKSAAKTAEKSTRAKTETKNP